MNEYPGEQAGDQEDGNSGYDIGNLKMIGAFFPLKAEEIEVYLKAFHK